MNDLRWEESFASLSHLSPVNDPLSILRPRDDDDSDQATGVLYSFRYNMLHSYLPYIECCVANHLNKTFSILFERYGSTFMKSIDWKIVWLMENRSGGCIMQQEPTGSPAPPSASLVALWPCVRSCWHPIPNDGGTLAQKDERQHRSD